MSGSLILLPLRVGVRATALAVRGAREIVEQGGRPGRPGPRRGALARFPPDARKSPTRTEAPPRPAQTQTAAPPAPARAVEPGDAIDYDTSTPPEPAHIDADAELVEEVAEPGAEDGAGAEVHIAEPWDGYRALRAADVIDRLATATPEELAAIELYEISSRKRRTVIAAAQRELSSRRGPAHIAPGSRV